MTREQVLLAGAIINSIDRLSKINNDYSNLCNGYIKNESGRSFESMDNSEILNMANTKALSIFTSVIDGEIKRLQAALKSVK